MKEIRKYEDQILIAQFVRWRTQFERCMQTDDLQGAKFAYHKYAGGLQIMMCLPDYSYMMDRLTSLYGDMDRALYRPGEQ